MLNKLSCVSSIEIFGGLRRIKHYLNQIDLAVASSDQQHTMDQLLTFPNYDNLINRTSNSLTLQLTHGIPLQIWFSTPQNFSCLLLLTTGSEIHIREKNRIAAQFDKQITNNGILDKGKTSTFGEEAQIYSLFRLPFIPPEVREGIGEIETAKLMDFTNVIKLSDLNTDLHMHTNWSDGKNCLEEIVCAAISHQLSIITITDHSPHNLSPRYHDDHFFSDQHKTIDLLNEKYASQVSIIKGVEVDILPNGDLDLSNEML